MTRKLRLSRHDKTTFEPNVQSEEASPTNDTAPEQVDLERAVETEEPEPRKLTIIRDLGSDSAPNVSLNCHDRFHRWEIYAAALFGIFLQAGVVVFSGFITYHRPLKSSFKKDGEPVDDYAFSCAAVGTVLLAVGILLCAVVVESSTEEDSFTTTDQETELRMVWLQKKHITNDQVFKPFAIYPENCRPFITTSRRIDRLDKQQDSNKPPIDMKILTVVGTAMALIGFAVQFVGLRGLNWAASVAQLGAVIAMTVARAVVRRGLANPPRSSALTPDFELDWFAHSLIDPSTAPWKGGKGSDEVRDPSQAGDEGLPHGWAVHSGQRKQYREFMELNESSDPRVLQADSAAQQIVNIRRELGNLADWQGPAADEAVRLSKAIELVARAFIPDDLWGNSFTWTLPVNVFKGQVPSATMGDKISIHLTPTERGWKVDSEIIDAVLSLWMHSVRSREGKRPDIQTPRNKRGGDRFRSQIERGSGLRLYGSCVQKAQIERDILWWMPEAKTEVFMTGSVSEYMKKHGISHQRVVGFGPDSDASDYSACAQLESATRCRSHSVIRPTGSDEKHNGVEDGDIVRNGNMGIAYTHTATLALQCDDPLERLLSRDLMFSFITAVAKAHETLIATTVVEDSMDYSNTQGHKRMRLHDDRFTNLARDLEKIGYGSLSEVYLDLIIPLSIENKMSNLNIVIRTAQKRAKEYELSLDWDQLADVAVWLLDFAMSLDPNKDHEHPFIVAVCLDILRRIRNAEMLIESERVSLDGKASSGRKTLKNAFRHAKLQNSSYFFDMAQIRRENWEKDLLENALRVSSPSLDGIPAEGFPRVFGITEAHQDAMRGDYDLDFDVWEAAQKDTFGWTSVHYALVQFPEKLRWERGFLRFTGRRSLEQADFRGWTILHYACQHHKDCLVDLLAMSHDSLKDLTASGNDGATPFHCAVRNPDSSIVEFLTRETRDKYFSRPPLFRCESDGGPTLRDCYGRSPTHWAAMEGSLEWIKATHKDAHLKDKFGLTALHLAVIYGRREVFDFLLRQTGSMKDELSGNVSRSVEGYSPLHLALLHEKTDIIESLLNAGVDVNKMTSTKTPPLRLATTKEAAAMLIAKGADIDAKDNEGNTPLFYTIIKDRLEVASELIEAGADVNTTHKYGYTPLGLAVGKGQEEFALQLLANGADHAIAYSSKHDSPLHSAVRKGSIKVVKAIVDLDKTASRKAIFMTDADGDSPLHELARYAEEFPLLAVPILDELLAFSTDVDINVRNKYGETPLDLALSRRNKEFAGELRQRGATETKPTGSEIGSDSDSEGGSAKHAD